MPSRSPPHKMHRVIPRPFGRQWRPIGIFVLYTALNMLDRQLLAAVAPALRAEFHCSNAQSGQRNLTGPGLSYKMSYMGKPTVSVRELQQHLKRVLARV